MDEIIQFIQSVNRRRTANRPSRSISIYVVCSELGSIFVIKENGTVLRKANVQAYPDHILIRPDAIRTFDEMFRSNSHATTIFVRDKATVTLMYCHRTIQIVDAFCQKILLFGPSCLLFGDMNNESLQNIDYQLSDSEMTHIERRPPHPENHYYDLLDKDEIDLLDGEYYLRISSNKHCLYINPNMFHRCVRYKSSRPGDSDNNLQSIVDNLMKQSPSVVAQGH